MKLKKIDKHPTVKQLRLIRRKLFRRLVRRPFKIYKRFSLKRKRLKRFRTLPGFGKVSGLNTPMFSTYILPTVYMTRYIFTKIAISITNKRTLARSTKAACKFYLTSKRHNYLPSGTLRRLGLPLAEQGTVGLTNLVLLPNVLDLRKYSAHPVKRVMYMWRYTYLPNKENRHFCALASLSFKRKSQLRLLTALTTLTSIFR